MTTAERARQDYFEKCTAELEVALEDRRRAYSIYHDACERVKRIESKRSEAWGEMMGSIVRGEGK